MNISFDPNAIHAARAIINEMLKDDLPGPIDERQSQVMAVLRGHEVVGGVMWHNFHPRWRSVEMSMATFMPVVWTRRLMQAMVETPFLQWGCHTVAMATGPDNLVNRLAPRAGFEKVVIPHIRAGQPEILWILAAPKWAKMKFASQEMREAFLATENQV